MKNILLIAVLIAFALPVQAQRQKIYVDTTLAGQIHAANAASAAAIARGYTGFTTAPADFNYSNTNPQTTPARLYVQFWIRGKTSATLAAATSFTQDTVRIQGLLVNKSAGNKLDTLWEDIPLRQSKSLVSNDAGGAAIRDTLITTHTAGSTLGNAAGYRSPIFELPKRYDTYRAINGKCDSGRVVIRWISEPQ